MLHVTNGEAAAAPLRDAGLPGTVIVWADVLHDGPVLDGLSGPEWCAVRATALAAAGHVSSEAEARAVLAAWDAALEQADAHDELVLWFEHDLFDQLLLVRHLAWLARRPALPRRVALVCIDRHPDVPHFHGLGQLSPAQLGALFPTRSPIGGAHVALGQSAWRAFTSPDPTAIERLLTGDTSALPFLRGALERYLQEFPSVRNGLPRTEQRALEALATGPRSAGDLFRAVQGTEERVYMGDLSFYARLRDLARGDAPLVAGHGLDVLPLADFCDAEVRLTAMGRQVVGGRADWIHWNGIDRWLGGVHLEGRDAAWRWDDERRRLVSGRAQR